MATQYHPKVPIVPRALLKQFQQFWDAVAFVVLRLSNASKLHWLIESTLEAPLTQILTFKAYLGELYNLFCPLQALMNCCFMAPMCIWTCHLLYMLQPKTEETQFWHTSQSDYRSCDFPHGWRSESSGPVAGWKWLQNWLLYVLARMWSSSVHHHISLHWSVLHLAPSYLQTNECCSVP